MNYPAVAARQRVENGPVEHEHAPHLAGALAGVVKRSLVFAAQITAHPDQGGIESFVHPRSLPQE